MRPKQIFLDSNGAELLEGDWVARLHRDGEVMEYGEVRKDSTGDFVVGQFSREGFFMQNIRADLYKRSRWDFIQIQRPMGMKV